jgi:hypothetical protein
VKIPAPQSAGIFYCQNVTRLTATARLDDHVAVGQTRLDADDATVGVMTAPIIVTPAFVTATIMILMHGNTGAASADDDLGGSRQSADNGSGNNGAQNKNFHFQTPSFHMNYRNAGETNWFNISNSYLRTQ